MGRNVFLSFLGTTNYKECNYTSNNKFKTSRFVQVGTISIHCKEWKNDDEYIFFMTKTAYNRNWKKDAENGHSLLLELKAEGIMPKCIEIPEEINNDASAANIEKEIWQIFEIIHKELKIGDNITFDITHSFRYMPMLAMTLLNYAKVLKKTTISGIYYGAFEVLGQSYQIEEKYPNIEDRKAPIVNLTAFVTLQEWTTAANNFIEYGKGEEINKLLNEPIEELESVLDNFYTSRGKNLSLGLFFKELKINLLKKSSEINIKPFNPITKRILSKIEPFIKTEEGQIKKIISNTLLSVNWCYEHNLIQQGFTILQEGLVTIVLTELGKDFKEKTLRNIASSCFTIWNKDELGWKGDASDNKEITREFLSKTELFKLINKKKKPYFTKISIFRNDLNHAGYLKDAKSSSDFSPKLQEYSKAVENVLYEYYKI